MKVPKTVVLAGMASGWIGIIQPGARADDFGSQTLTLINTYRESHGLSRLTPNSILKGLARDHSRYQASRRRISHDGYRGRSAEARAAGLSGICAENVGHNYANALQLFSGWRNSSDHNINLLRSNLRYAGVSVVGNYATFFACK
jgi:uncharacterized protein YkwD